MQHSRIRALALAGVALGALLAPVAKAQEQTGQRVAIEEIVVTARKVEERLQDVPLSISAFTAQDLQRRQIAGLEDVARYTPGFVVEGGGSSFFTVPVLRGLTVVDVQGQVQNVPTFVDGIYLQRNYAIDFGAADITRIEIVKGPQSALYGQSAFAGAINYILGKPTEEWQGEVSGTVGTRDRLDVSGWLSGPIIRDRLSVRFGYSRTDYNGTWKNNFPNAARLKEFDFDYMGGRETENFTAAVELKPIESLTLTAQFLNGSRTEEPTGQYSVAAVSDPWVRFNCGPTAPNGTGGRFICGELTANPKQWMLPNTPRADGIVIPPHSPTTSDMNFYKFGARWEVTEDITVNYLYGAIQAKAAERSAVAIDPVSLDPRVNSLAPTLPFPPFAPLPGAIPTFQGQKNGGKNDFWSHELRVDYEPQDLPLSARLGVYRSRARDQSAFLTLRVPAGPNAVFIDPSGDAVLSDQGYAGTLTRNFRRDQTRAIFGQVSFDFLDDRATVTAEGRYQKENRFQFDPRFPTLRQKGNFSVFTPRFTAEYKITDENLLYASAAKGVKAGGFNGFSRTVLGVVVPLTTAEQTFDDEKNWTYEIGSKNAFFDGTLIFNANAFYIDWSALQIQSLPSRTPALPPGVNPVVIFQNLGNARSWGIELQGQWQATDNLAVTAGFGWADPKYKRGTKSVQFAPFCSLTPTVCPADGELGGKQIQRTSKITATVGAQWEAQINDSLGYYVRADMTYRSRQFVDVMSLTRIGSVTLVNASIGLTGGDNWELQLWAKNLFDKEYVGSSFFIVGFASYSPFLGDKRTLGLTGTFRF
jgi:iron complex outermembrane receptor protein